MINPFLAKDDSLHEDRDEHECVFEETDCDICSDCKEHAAFCEECGSECCGAPEYMPD